MTQKSTIFPHSIYLKSRDIAGKIWTARKHKAKISCPNPSLWAHLMLKKSSKSCSEYLWADQDSLPHLCFPPVVQFTESLFTALLLVQRWDLPSRVQMTTDVIVGAEMRWKQSFRAVTRVAHPEMLGTNLKNETILKSLLPIRGAPRIHLISFHGVSVGVLQKFKLAFYNWFI